MASFWRLRLLFVPWLVFYLLAPLRAMFVVAYIFLLKEQLAAGAEDGDTVGSSLEHGSSAEAAAKAAKAGETKARLEAPECVVCRRKSRGAALSFIGFVQR